ncbi:hypothetical protein OH799_03325 [Nocardia sp. NBC_00881]|uniref:hypothetical protein n=1 Tax=Nocardia sp. NBC_00881 TaxID=2975995 RepID=UPI00386A52C1|nr:hypothetical protein OH799_03325 [Nocardia sp. NBC_00881]
MVKAALGSALAAAALLVVGAGQASAVPVVNPGPLGAPIDGILSDTAGVAGYNCLVLGPGWGFGMNTPGATGVVSGTFFAPGPVSAYCMGPMGYVTGGGFAS